jgi:hypothetical protein
METWESEETLQQFYEAKLKAALQAADAPQIQPRIFTVVNSLGPETS